MSTDRLRELWDELRENWDDPYWRADHPEIMVVVLGVISGIIGLAFAVIEALLLKGMSDG
jgi:hypothetical protein